MNPFFTHPPYSAIPTAQSLRRSSRADRAVTDFAVRRARAESVDRPFGRPVLANGRRNGRIWGSNSEQNPFRSPICHRTLGTSRETIDVGAKVQWPEMVCGSGIQRPHLRVKSASRLPCSPFQTPLKGVGTPPSPFGTNRRPSAHFQCRGAFR